jgi:hypothetical protein
MSMMFIGLAAIVNIKANNVHKIVKNTFKLHVYSTGLLLLSAFSLVLTLSNAFRTELIHQNE